MKHLLLAISLLALAACGPKFKAGDCIIDENEESWEKGVTVMKIAQVGRYKYRIFWEKPDYMKGEEHSFNRIRSIDSMYDKIECPKPRMLK